MRQIGLISATTAQAIGAEAFARAIYPRSNNWLRETARAGTRSRAGRGSLSRKRPGGGWQGKFEVGRARWCSGPDIDPKTIAHPVNFFWSLNRG